jgi:hypothetical protein
MLTYLVVAIFTGICALVGFEAVAESVDSHKQLTDPHQT